MHAAIAAIGSIFAALRSFPFAIRTRFVACTQVTLLGSIDASVATIAGILARLRTTAVASVVDPIVALFAGVHETIATLQLAVRITGTQNRAVAAPVVALLAGIDFAIAAGTQCYPTAAIRIARAR